MNVQLLLQQAQKRHKDQIRIRPKNDRRWFWWLLSFFLKLITLGKGPDLLNGQFYTTLGRTIWVPGDGSSWDTLPNPTKYALLSHELDHMDAEFFGDHTLQDHPGFIPQEKGLLFRFIHALKYLFWPLPIFWAGYRQQIESWGFQRNLEAHLVRHHGVILLGFREQLKLYLCGPSYAWMATEKRAEELIRTMIGESMERFRTGKLDHLRS